MPPLQTPRQPVRLKEEISYLCCWRSPARLREASSYLCRLRGGLLATALLPCHCGLAIRVCSPASNHYLLSDSTSTSRRDSVVATGEGVHTPAVTRRRRNVEKGEDGLSDPPKLLSCPYKSPVLAVDRVRVCRSLSQTTPVSTVRASCKSQVQICSRHKRTLRVFGASHFGRLFTTCGTLFENFFRGFPDHQFARN